MPVSSPINKYSSLIVIKDLAFAINLTDLNKFLNCPFLKEQILRWLSHPSIHYPCCLSITPHPMLTPTSFNVATSLNDLYSSIWIVYSRSSMQRYSLSRDTKNGIERGEIENAWEDTLFIEYLSVFIPKMHF
jgi:hypothetical protein